MSLVLIGRCEIGSLVIIGENRNFEHPTAGKRKSAPASTRTHSCLSLGCGSRPRNSSHHTSCSQTKAGPQRRPSWMRRNLHNDRNKPWVPQSPGSRRSACFGRVHELGSTNRRSQYQKSVAVNERLTIKGRKISGWGSTTSRRRIKVRHKIKSGGGWVARETRETRERKMKEARNG